MHLICLMARRTLASFSWWIRVRSSTPRNPIQRAQPRCSCACRSLVLSLLACSMAVSTRFACRGLWAGLRLSAGAGTRSDASSAPSAPPPAAPSPSARSTDGASSSAGAVDGAFASSARPSERRGGARAAAGAVKESASCAIPPLDSGVRGGAARSPAAARCEGVASGGGEATLYGPSGAILIRRVD